MEIIALSGISFLLSGCSSNSLASPEKVVLEDSIDEDVAVELRIRQAIDCTALIDEVKCLDERLLQAKIKMISEAVQDLLDRIKKKKKNLDGVI